LKLKVLFSLLFIIFLVDAQAGFFGNLFERDKQHDTTITQEDAIIEEEVITADDYIDSVDEPTDIEVFSDEPQKKAFDENEEFYVEEDDDNPLVRSQSIFLSYIKKPEKIYLSQHAYIKIKAIITNNNVDDIKTSFINSKNVKILNPNSSWRKVSDTTYENSYTLKVFSTDAHIPDIKITTSANGKVRSETLPSFNPKIIALREDKAFSLVLADDFTLLDHHEKKYDEKSNIVVLEINATGSNLEDFHIPYALRDGIDDIKYNGNNQRIYYFAIIPNDIKIFKFKYFDLQNNKYNIVSFPVILQDSSVSTQTDLNPEESRYALYKAIALVVLAFIIFLFYLKSRKIYILILSLIVLAFTFYIRMPMSKILLHKGVKLRILPTKNSTIFYITEKDTEADKLLVRDGYIKVLLPNKKIGWINENSAKN